MKFKEEAATNKSRNLNADNIDPWKVLFQSLPVYVLLLNSLTPLFAIQITPKQQQKLQINFNNVLLCL